MKHITIFIDGSCIGNPGPGGYGCIIKHKKYEKLLSAGYYFTTNNRMEIISSIMAIKQTDKSFLLNINTDSQYLKQGITKWIHIWKEKNWKTSCKKPVKNIDLWLNLYFLTKNYKINWNWIKSHSVNLDNNRCDKLARLAALNPTLNDTGYIK